MIGSVLRLLATPIAVSLALAAALRIIWALMVGVDPVSDAAAYDIFATNIAEHGVYGFTPDEPGAYWAVGTSGLYAGVYLLFGTGSAVGIVALNLLSSLVVVWLLWDLGRRWFGETEGRIAALLFALWPMAIQFTTILASELHFMALTLAALAAWDRVRGITAISVGWLILSGLCFGAATYVRPIALLIPAVLALAALLRAPRSALGPVVMAGVATAIIFASVAPWSARNERVFGEPVFMSTNFWPNFWMGNHPETNGEYTPLPEDTPRDDEIARSEHMKALALEDLRADPAGIIWRTGWKAAKLHARETIGVGWNEAGISAAFGSFAVPLLKLVSTAWWYSMLAAALGGAMVLLRRQGPWRALLSPPIWLWGYFTGVHAVIVVGDRYHMPAIPMIALLAALALSALAARKRVVVGADTPAGS